ncbi:MAG: TraK family protein [Candidatus Accumulibacter sp.]|nr:TraK family protein [Accumulibacter sp.]
MAKSLSARIAERIARKKPTGNVRNRAAFLALRGEVKQAIDDGWSVKTIWEALHDEEKVTFSYQAFRGYVNRLILSPPASGEATPLVVADQSRQAAPRLVPQLARTPAEWKPEKLAATGFTFNKTPKKEDLL